MSNTERAERPSTLAEIEAASEAVTTALSPATGPSASVMPPQRPIPLPALQQTLAKKAYGNAKGGTNG